ncbi:hypothetical protein Hanom_Chr12g01149461 [Helianthus anomalus]
MIPFFLKGISLPSLLLLIRHALQRRKVPWSNQTLRNWLITNGLVEAFEYLCQSGPFTTLIDRLSATAYQSGHHDGFYKGYFECQQSEKITPEFHTTRGKLQGDIADALEVAYNEPLPAYADLMDKVNEDGIDSLRLMLDPAEESEEELVFSFRLLFTLFLKIFCMNLFYLVFVQILDLFVRHLMLMS